MSKIAKLNSFIIPILECLPGMAGPYKVYVRNQKNIENMNDICDLMLVLNMNPPREEQYMYTYEKGIGYLLPRQYNQLSDHLKSFFELKEYPR